MPVSPEEVRRVAALARLALSDAEAAAASHDLSRILEHVEKLQALDLAQVPPTSHVLDLSTAFRPDEPRAGLGHDEALYNAPLADGGLFVVPQVIKDR